MFVPSPQQAAFINEAKTGSSSIVLIAVAGAGKTTVILKAVSQMRGNSIILAYNKKIAEEIKAKLKRDGVDWKKAEASTVHAIGLRNYRKAFPAVRVDADKVGNMCAALCESGFIGLHLVPHTAVICKLVSFAKQNAFGIIGDIEDHSIWWDVVDHFDLFDEEPLQKKAEEVIGCAIELLNKSNRESAVVDFDDMIYLPLLYQIPFFQYDNVVMDEAQDANIVRKLMADALLKNGGRFYGVGDPRQAIYGFCGADNDSIENLKAHFNCKEMPLTVTYRCPKAIVNFARSWVDHIESHPSAPEGIISMESFEQMLQGRNRLNGDSAILCRNTRPLVSAAFTLIREKVPCRIEGRDIGETLKKLATRWKSITTIPELEDKLEEWLETEIEKWTAKKKLARIQEAEDKVETLKVVMNACRQDGQNEIHAVVSYIENIFADNVSSILTLSTIHRSKGREWKRVFWLDRFNTCPSRYASQDWEVQQESNLQYVCATRSMSELIDLLPPVQKPVAVNDNQKPVGEKAA